MEAEGARDFSSLIVLTNAAFVSAGLIGLAFYFRSAKLSEDAPTGRQNAGEWVLDFFVGKARDMSHGLDQRRVVRLVAPLLASFFLFIFFSNVFGMLPIPLLNRPPTSHFSVTLALAISSVVGTLALSAVFKGPAGAAKHLVWPNPMQWISEFTDVFSLSLRLFGNIGGEYMTLVLVSTSVAIGIPLVLHLLGLIPAFVQALVFTLLTASFIASAIHHEEKKKREKKRRFFKKSAPAVQATMATGEGV